MQLQGEKHQRVIEGLERRFEGLYTITGLDWWTGLVDWTGGLDWWTGLRIFSLKHTIGWLQLVVATSYLFIKELYTISVKT